MSTHCNCKHPTNHPQAPSSLRRLRSGLVWLLPGAALALVPKCPVCIAAYLTLATGLGVSAAMVQTAQWALISAGVVALGYILVKKICARRGSSQ